jgi:hypothetical protein
MAHQHAKSRWAPPTRHHWWAVPALLVLTTVLAVTSLVRDSITFDETSHLTAGMSYLKTGDFRLAPDHPPLAKIWCALPLLFMRQEWPADDENWQRSEVYPFGRRWLCVLNDPQRLIVPARCMMVVWLLATCLTTYALARRLFGPTAGLLALALASLSPTLLAHGRLVTTDLPITLFTALTLLAYARLLERFTWPRLLAAALTLAASAVTKMSWPLILPGLAAMGLLFLFPLPRREGAGGGSHPALPLRGGGVAGRATLLAATTLFMAAVVALGIWTCYGWRATVVPPLKEPAADAAARTAREEAIAGLAQRAQRALTDRRTGAPRTGLTPTLVRGLAATGVLPEAYVLGLALTVEATQERGSYLHGSYANTGYAAYFPIAFAIKTPLATMGLLLAGMAALALRCIRSRDRVLLGGLVAFALVYAAAAIVGGLNIGQRHLLPLYPVLFVIGSAAAGWLTSRSGRWLVGGALAWLLAANLYIHPQYLAYFNELIGGPRHGYEWLADSNIDWGQDLVRLGAYARKHPAGQIKLAYFGSALPTRYVACTALPSYYEFEPQAALTSGTYVISVTQLLGVYDIYVRDEFWNADAVHTYEVLRRFVAARTDSTSAPNEQSQRARLTKQYEDMRTYRLLNRLRHRPPDDYVGYSMFVYRLTATDLAQLTR